MHRRDPQGKCPRAKVRIHALTLVWLALAARPSIAADNPLLGSWRWDNGKTLRNLQVPAEGSQELLESAQRTRTFVANLNAKLNSNVVVSFSKNEYTQSTFGPGGDVFSRESVPYRVIEVHADRIVIADRAEGGTSTLFFDGPASFYVEVSVGTFIYKDYFTREP